MTRILRIYTDFFEFMLNFKPKFKKIRKIRIIRVPIRSTPFFVPTSIRITILSAFFAQIHNAR
ncbi:MAG: hypothetical protein RLZZ628_2078 [Bacteroidota bacterium]|jgi:hypothetical protein